MSDGGIAIGERAPELSLPDTRGETHSLGPGDAAATVVYWTCNHCPYALAWQDRLHDVADDYLPRGVRFLAVNSNDAERYPADSPRAMANRVEREEWSHPFLHDQSQDAARDFGARVTPDVFVLDSDLVLRYRGAPDADHEDPAQDARWLRDALDAVLQGAEPEPVETEPVGCTIKWRS